MKAVGPTTNRNTASTRASTMLKFDRYWMPFSTPETAEKMKQIVRMTMIDTSAVPPTLLTQPFFSRPAAICRAPRPSDAAEPNKVAKIARPSMTLPTGPSARRRPMSGTNVELMSWLRPLRNVPYAMATPTTA